ncbi:hypothetical protein [Marinomonas sp. 2405UD68-3]|uniref:hypothetical protein n=1 Tax=Marinomonas sp. 2405UD68-3 TaxID=3391835 RepID=UPI0039C99267
MISDPKDLLKKNEQLIHSDAKRVVSHVQRQKGEWILHTIMLEDCDVPFRFKRQKKYMSLDGCRVNLTYYADTELVAGMSMEIMKVVRIKRT